MNNGTTHPGVNGVSSPEHESSELACKIVDALLRDDRFKGLVRSACGSALNEVVITRLVKEVTLETVMHYGAIEKMERGHQVWQAFKAAGIVVSSKPDDELAFIPEERLTPALTAIAEVHYHVLRDHVRNLERAAEYRDTLEAELWPGKYPLGVLDDMRAAGLRPRLEEGRLKVGPPAKITHTWKRWIERNKPGIVRELQAEQR